MNIILALYFFIHGACALYGSYKLSQIDWNSFRNKEIPAYARIHPVLVASAFLLGPLGLLIHGIVYLIIPNSQKITYQ
jgi:hypothetical protein